MSTAIVKRGGVTSPSTSSSVHSCAYQHNSIDEPLFDDQEKKEEEERKEEKMREERKKSCSPPPSFLISEETLQKRLQDALRERDNQWMNHEKAQISFLQRESGNMLRGLHSEIDRLSTRLRDSRRLIDVGHCASEREMAERMEEKDRIIEELESALQEKEEKLKEIERRVGTTMERMNEQISIQADRIRQLNGELQDRTQSVAQLTSQLRSYRLKEAMSLAQQRRRVSNVTGPSSPLVSPSSPHRSFPPFSTYPGGSQSARGPSPNTSLQCAVLPLSSSNNIDEKPRSSKPRIRSNSAFGQQSQ